MSNFNLNKAKKAKNDEFYTQLTDIEKELKHYRMHFKDKIVFCNCDDPFESNFFKYFVLNFNKLGLKKLIATSYVSSDKKPYKAVINTVYDKTGNDAVEMLDVAELFESGENELTELEGDGDFRSDECIALLKQSDIVVTNPPFSLFREYVAQLMKYNKKFVIIGNQNAITYKEFFPLLKENEIWIGYGFNKIFDFVVPNNYKWDYINNNNEKIAKVPSIAWFTNLDIKKHYEDLILVEKYSSKKYPKYDNYDAIEVSKVVNIPSDYDGVMGVPITFMDKYNPNQFEILGITDRENSSGLRIKKYTADDAVKYNDMNRRSVLKINGKYKLLYARILIRNKHSKQPKEGMTWT